MSIITKPVLLARYLSLFPRIKKQLKHWWDVSEQLPIDLRQQAQSSLTGKAFHCLGGAVYLLYPSVDQSVLLQAIVALQTISDYLDNLCDRMPVNDGRAFWQLHLSFLEALDLNRSLSDYYLYYPYQESVYLPSLVNTCRNQISQMPYYADYQEYINQLASYYCHLQVLKHLVPSGAEKLQNWIMTTFAPDTTPLLWNEWAAAAGSTLGIFYCLAASFSPSSPEMRKMIFDVYFPWIQSFHILLDYYIDQLEDLQHQDLNFVAFYHDQQQASERLYTILQECRRRVQMLPSPALHELILQGLVAMYGSDPKLQEQNLLPYYRRLLDSAPQKFLFKSCRMLRAINVLS